MKKLNLYIITFIIFFFNLLVAQQYEIPHSVFGSGGEISNNNDYQLIGTLGQPIIGETNNADHIKHIGFWYIIDASTVTAIDEPFDHQIPNQYVLMQNYPNPFNPSTIIKFDLPKSTDVRIEVYNVAGQKIRTLLNEKIAAGNHQVEFNAQDLSSGVYFYRIDAGEFQDVKKMILLR